MKHARSALFVVLLFVALSLGSGCSSLASGSAPHWLDTLYDRQYDEDTYLCALGSGSSREKATDAALSSLSQVFNSQVRSVTTVLSRSTAQDSGDGQVKFSTLSEMVDQGSVTSSTDKIVGAQVVNTYVDDTARVYVRVALDRKKTAEIYQKEIDELDISIMSVRRELITRTEPLARYFTLLKALSFAQRQQDLYDQMQVLLKKSQNSTLFSLERELATIASSVRVAVTVDSLGDHQMLFSAFSQKLVALGFAIVPLDANPSAYLNLHYESTPIELKDSPYKYVRYSLSAQLVSGDVTLFTYQVSEREAALSSEDAQKKALMQATTLSVSEFFTLLQKRLGDSM